MESAVVHCGPRAARRVSDAARKLRTTFLTSYNSNTSGGLWRFPCTLHYHGEVLSFCWKLVGDGAGRLVSLNITAPVPGFQARLHFCGIDYGHQATVRLRAEAAWRVSRYDHLRARRPFAGKCVQSSPDVINHRLHGQTLSYSVLSCSF